MINLVLGCSSSPEKSNNTEVGSNSRATTGITNKDSFFVQDTSKKVADQTITINVSNAAIECGCPQWFETKGNAVALGGSERFYLEPINKDLINANNLWDGEHLPLILKVTGRFSKEKEIPITYYIKGTIQKARIFWYDNITVESSSSYKGISSSFVSSHSRKEILYDIKATIVNRSLTITDF